MRYNHISNAEHGTPMDPQPVTPHRRLLALIIALLVVATATSNLDPPVQLGIVLVLMVAMVLVLTPDVA
jgi:hypothetical protein